MIKIELLGIKSIQDIINKRIKQFGPRTSSVLVGYGGGEVDYAAPVHEGVHGTNKPINYTTPGTGRDYISLVVEYSSDMAVDIVSQELLKGASMIDALYKAGQFLLQESESLVPSDTGTLVETGFVEAESNAGS